MDRRNCPIIILVSLVPLRSWDVSHYPTDLWLKPSALTRRLQVSGTESYCACLRKSCSVRYKGHRECKKLRPLRTSVWNCCQRVPSLLLIYRHTPLLRSAVRTKSECCPNPSGRSSQKFLFSTSVRPQLKDNSIEGSKSWYFKMQKQLLICKECPDISGTSIFRIIMPELLSFIYSQ